MSSGSPGDPFQLFRQLVNQWEKIANDVGGQAMKTSEFAQGMQGATAFSLQVQQAVHDGMTKVLAAANMPSREDLAAIGERIAQLESQLSRIEAALGNAGQPSPAAAKPKRTRKPPRAAS